MKIRWDGFASTAGRPVRIGATVCAWDLWSDGTHVAACRRRPPKRKPKHLMFRPPPPPRRRASRCLRADGQHKVPYTEDEGRQRLAEMLDRNRRPGRIPQLYLSDCGWWHIGNPPVVSNRPPYTYRIVEREIALLLELDERAAVQLLQGPRSADAA